MKPGCYTALATPFTPDGLRIDQKGLEQLIDFQIANGITGILAVGTTGESPTLGWSEHNAVVDTVARLCRDHCLSIAGAGSNNTQEALNATAHAVKRQVDAVLLVDPYYNGPSSLEIRREYVAPIAARFPGMEIIPYVIPGRTGAQLLPEDLALLNQAHPNVSGVKEATADPNNMRRTRACCGPDFLILSGDDAMTFEMMTDPAIAGGGVISVLSNIAPAAVTQLVQKLAAGDRESASTLLEALTPLFGLVTVKTTETTPHGDVVCRARNPLALKTLMRLLGMPAGPCRPPLGKMTRKGLDVVLAAARQVWTENPDILKPIERFFGVRIEERLDDPRYREELFYSDY
ncbi:4-hydroxy-tetrahydrodipicolinate synthase family protein [Desulfatitalea alkaliphila]|uniref:4-hydroxy-tetrahydrodipicolinate synthase n=1 Tax=Desulfatitalea alkaliphila TaxID=2929485 RepID=A0AA41QZ63_9BACT|nr:4-hydroxy-tetrahydrodipicolinate synthase [Desulfatitalea alkaliphila]MCJ8499113.1 4-hydroxy-tetrahydrodipicolinate synthase [Desulfatitalea alkaliphila]